MEVINGYFDYCISEQCIKSGDFHSMVKFLFELGYKTVAVNQVVDEANLETKKKKKKGEPRDVKDVVPAPIEFKNYEDCGELRLLNRLTIIFSNQDVINKIIKSPNYKKYHIVAVLPETQSAFQFTCSNLDADILSYNPENKIPYKINRRLYKQLVEKGFHFEILYGPAIQDSSQRKNMIHLSHLYQSVGKSKNVIISSGAMNRMMLRGPYDIICLGFIFGLSEEQAKNSIMRCGRDVFLNSVGRRHGKTAVFVENLKPNDDGDDDMELTENSDEEMELEHQPAQKKSKQ